MQAAVYVQVVAASQYPNQIPKWATGNADAVRNALFLFGLDSPQQRRVEDGEEGSLSQPYHGAGSDLGNLILKCMHFSVASQT